MNPNEVITQLKQLGAELSKANDKLYKTASNKAVAERDYRKALAVTELKLRQDKLPATLIIDVARGNDVVSELKLERDKQIALYDACKYEINALHTRISIGQSMLTWFREEFKASNQLNE